MDAQALLLNVQHNIEVSGNTVSIPPNNYAKLSYYLHCIAACVPDLLEDRLTNHRNYLRFSDETKAEIFIISIILNPQLLQSKGIFIQLSEEELHQIDQGSNNTFLRITERINLGMIDLQENGQVNGLNINSTEVTNRMAYTVNWVNTFFLSPLENILAEEPARHANNNRPVNQLVGPGPVNRLDLNYAPPAELHPAVAEPVPVRRPVAEPRPVVVDYTNAERLGVNSLNSTVNNTNVRPSQPKKTLKDSPWKVFVLAYMLVAVMNILGYGVAYGCMKKSKLGQAGWKSLLYSGILTNLIFAYFAVEMLPLLIK